MPKPTQPRLILFNKPFRVLSDRDPESGRPSIADYVPFPDVHPAGRLDYDSEGLLVLTNDGRLQHHIIHPRHKLPKTYWVQVEGGPDARAIAHLAEGILLKDGVGLAVSARRIPPPDFPPRDPPVQVRNDIGSSWLEIVLTEGRKRQVRRMTAAIGHPTLRLVRIAIGPWRLGDLFPGQWRLIRNYMDEIRKEWH
jgi:23S rRNA pseudouridine2457 synthase